MSEPTPHHPCPFCEKQGLAILPLRYAVARTQWHGKPIPDAKAALDLPPEFARGDVADIPLPGGSVKYTTRLLRAGYLYVFNVVRGEWQGYLVTELGYLYKFLTMRVSGGRQKVVSGDYAPPDGDKIEFHCFRTGEEYLARCIAIPDADRAGKVWLGFSDTAWTPAVFSKHGAASYRDKHMRAVDVGAWAGGNTRQPLTATFDKLASVVNEFAYAGPDPNAPSEPDAPYTGTLKEEWDGKELRVTLPTVTVRGYLYPPFDFSPQRFCGIEVEAEGLKRWGGEQPHAPMMAVLDDPAGIAMELNQAALKSALEWTEQPRRQWAFATATAIAGIQAAVRGGAAEQEAGDRAFRVDMSMAARANRQGFSGDSWQRYQRERTAAQKLTPEEVERLGAENWKKYQKMYDEPGRQAFLKQYSGEFSALERQVIKPLDAAYIAWLKAGSFKHYFQCNFDPADADSGQAYQAAAYACIHEASGRKAPCDYFAACLGNNPADPGEVILRAQVFNQDALVTAWSQAKADVESLTPWVDAADKLYQAALPIIGKEGSATFTGAMDGLSRYLHQLSGPVLNRLSSLAQKGVRPVLAALPEQRQLVLMQTMLRATRKNSGLFLVNLSGMQTRKQAARSLAGYLAALGGGNEQQWRSSARAMLDDAHGEKTSAWGGLFVVDKATLQQARSLKGARRVTAAQAASEVTEFGTLLDANARFLTSRAVAAGGMGLIITGFTLYLSYGELSRADGAEASRLQVSFAGGVATAIGETGELSGKLLAKTAWGSENLSRSIKVFGEVWETRAAMIGGFGKLLGVVGGVIVGLVQMWQGYKALEQGDVIFGAGSIVVGFGFALLPVIAWALALSGGAVLIIVLALLAIGYLVSLFKHDELQHWLDSCYFGKHDLEGEKYADLDAQRTALVAMAKGG